MRGVYRLALRYVGNHNDADDLTQQAFLKAYRSRGRFKRGTNFAAWVRKILVNLAVDESRKRRRRKEELQADFTAYSRPAPGGGAEDGDAADLAETARACMEALPRAQRVVMELRCVEGKTTEEIAEILGCAQGTVWWRLHAARNKLREMFASRLRRKGRVMRGLDE